MPKEDLICMALPSWNGDYAKSTVQLVHGLSRHYRILYVDYAYTLKDVLFSLLGIRKIAVRPVLSFKYAIRKEFSKTGEEIFILSLPPLLPVNWISHQGLFLKMSRWNARLAEDRIKRAMHQLDMHKPLLINAFQPFLGAHLVGKFKEKCLLYYCYDEIAEARWLGKHGAMMEKMLMQKATLVVTSSRALEERKKSFSRAISTITNGVDYALFEKALSILKKPQDRPVVGYTGSIDERFDTQLMRQVISQMPDCDFRFVGRVANANARETLQDFQNVSFAPAVGADEVPAIMRQMDVGIIPYLKNELTYCVYPLKINEFLAMGIPVVMTSFAQLEEFDQLVYRADQAGSFADALRLALQENDPQLKQQRISKAGEQSWQHQADKLHQLLQKYAHQNEVVLS